MGTNPALFINPWKPALLIFGIEAVQINTGRNIGSILILVFHTFFHTGQVNQIKHLIPVNNMSGADCFCSVLDCFFHQLHLFDTVSDQLQLNIQRIFHEMIICVINDHFADIVQ